jgi:CreA protein
MRVKAQSISRLTGKQAAPRSAPGVMVACHGRASEPASEGNSPMRIHLFAAVLALLSGSAFAQTRIDDINTNFRWLGPDDKIIVERYDDPRVGNVSCYMSRAATGGIKGGLGFAEDPSRFSIACRAVGPVTLPPSLPRSEVIAFAQASLFFKTFQIHRSLDPEKHVLVYTVVSTKLINGSPFNSISVVPTELR